MSLAALALVLALAFEPLATICFVIVPFAIIAAAFWGLVLALSFLS